MAVDEVLFERMDRPSEMPVIRLYGFSPPTISLGRFQSARETLEVDELEQSRVAVVRRPSGGRAVLHDNELTYAFIVGRHHIQELSKRSVYRFVSRRLIAALISLGVNGIVSRRQTGSPSDPDCFGSIGEFEIVSTEFRKLVGSAQATSRHAILQHGSIPLDDSNDGIGRFLRTTNDAHRTRASSSLEREFGRKASFQEALERFAVSFSAQLRVERAELTPEEAELAVRKAKEKYANDSWTYFR